MRQMTDTVRDSLRSPRLAFEGSRARSRMPSVDVSLGFTVYQQWQSAQARLLRDGTSVGAEDCVMAEVTAGPSSALALVCPLYVDGAQSHHHPPLSLHLQGGESLFGMRAATLIPATADSALATGFLEMLAIAGYRVPRRVYVHLAINGSPWGLYVMESGPGEVVVDDPEMSADSVWIAFDATALHHASVVRPEASFAYARPTFTPVGTIKLLDAADVHPEAPSAVPVAVYEAAEMLAALEGGDLAPSTVFDPEVIGQLIAASALWYGVPALDWQTLGLLYDPATRQFGPVISGSLPGSWSPLPATLTDDPAIHSATVRWLESYSSTPVPDRDLESLSVALGGKPDALRTLLARHQAAMAAQAAPARTLSATLSTEAAAVRLELRGIVGTPVEVLQLDFGARGSLDLDPAWIAEGSSVLHDSQTVILRARVSADPVRAVVRIPLTALPEGANVGHGSAIVVTRLLGGSHTIRVPVRVGAGVGW
jgi:hypothetical protein